MKSTFTGQDKVINSLREGQVALDKKMDKMTNQGEQQMIFMTDLLTEFKMTMMGASGPQHHIQSSIQQMAQLLIDNGATFAGAQPIPLGGFNS